MSSLRLGLVFATLVLLFLLATLPLRVMIGGTGVGGRAVTGSVWHGRIEAAVWRGVVVGDVDVGLAPLPLLVGTRRLDFTAATINGRVARTRRGVAIERLDGGFVPGAVAGLPVSDAQFVGFGATFAESRCSDARGTVTVRFGGTLAGQGTVSGAARCDGDRLLLPLKGEAGKIDLRFLGDGRYSADIAIDALDAAARPALLAAGFQPTPTGLALSVKGQF